MIFPCPLGETELMPDIMKPPFTRGIRAARAMVAATVFPATPAAAITVNCGPSTAIGNKLDILDVREHRGNGRGRRTNTLLFGEPTQ